mmetsp:Transcript_9536/g.23746  ORF Transcript_9536/g.23746 Transcript_9536/m.23746 type:complete len:415 (-) Transcript_9536:1253-2497(-)
MEDIALTPSNATVNGKSSPDNHSYLRDVEEGPFGRIDPDNGIHCAIIGDCEETNPLLGELGPIHPKPYTLGSPPCNGNDKTISFREILPHDRRRIQELFQKWFPVDYKEEFYDHLCNTRTMADQKLYTILATVQDNGHERIIACLLGCKLSARKLNEASRTLLVPGYVASNKNINKNTTVNELDQDIEDLASSGDPNIANDSNDDEDDDEGIRGKEVFYIMTLGVIEEYRKRGLASYLVKRAIQDQIVVAPIEDDADATQNLNESVDSDNYEELVAAEMIQPQKIIESTCETAYLHVIIQNQAAIRFYEKLGFARLREIADYYTIDEKTHNCYLYAKFYDKASIRDRREREKGLYSYYCYHYSKNLTAKSPVVDFVHRTMVRWITSIWSSVSYYWVLDGREGGRNPVLVAAKNK